MNTKHKVLSYLFVLLLLVAVFSCGKDATEPGGEAHHEEEENTVELTEAQIKTAGITLGAVEQKQISGTIKVNGLLDVPPQQLVSISVPFGGFLKSTTLLQGMHVDKGQLIAVIENPEYIQLQQDYLDAKVQFELSKKDFERQEELAKENVNAQKTLQQAIATYQSWQAKKSGAQAKLRMLNIDLANLEKGNILSTSNVYAPLSGFVTQVNVNVGKFVSPTDVLFEIVDTEHLHAELIIFEKDVPKIKIGQQVRFTLANEARERMATVYLIGREISPERTIRIHCHIDVEDKNLLPGMYLKAIVEAGSMPVNALPNEAIVDYQGKKFIFIQQITNEEHHDEKHEEGHQESDQEKEADDVHGEEAHGLKFKSIEVTTGASDNGYTEVILPEGFELTSKRIVLRGAYDLLSAMNNSEGEGHAH